MINFIHWLKHHLGLSMLIAVILFIAALFIPAAAIIVGGSDHEVSYSVSPIVSLCGKLLGKEIKGMTPENCMTRHEFKLANTGAKDQPHIAVSLPVSNVTVVDMRSYDLVASGTPASQVKLETTDLPGEYVVSQLPPNTLVVATLQTIGLADARTLAHEDTAVQAIGRVLNVDPQSAALVRMLYAMMGAFGL